MPLPSSRDHDQLRAGFERFLGDQRGPTTIDTFGVPEGAGYSSETYLVDATVDGRPERLVFRMGPEASDMPVFPSYDLSLQVNAIDLVKRHTDIPVPNVRWHATDESYVGAEFYVMDRVEGAGAPDNPPYVFGSWLTEASVAQRRRIQDHTADIMATLHGIPIDADAEAFLSRPDHGSTALTQHLAHQRWYYDWAREGVEYPVIEQALDWLDANRPAADPLGFNWGDARIGNILFHDFEPTAVVDWEMACLGAPAADVAWQLMLHHFFLSILDVMEMPNPFPDLFAIPEYVARYEATAGTKLDDLEWYYVFDHLRFAIISVRTSVRAVATGDMEPPNEPQDLVSNRALLEASMAGTNPYWVT